jgi:predicted ribosome quality control (RQC) complex YloA/Tae2 family protein
MKQSYYELALSVQSLNNYLSDVEAGVQVQKIFSSSHFIVLVLRFLGKTRYIYLGRGKEYEGMFIGDSNVPAEYRAQDSYLAYLRAHLRGGRLYKVYLDQDDRIISLAGGKSGEKFELLLFWRGRELFFVHSISRNDQDCEVTCSWQRRKISLSNVDRADLINLFNEVGRKPLKNREKRNDQIEIDDYLIGLKSEKQNVAGKKKKALKRKVENIKSDLVKFEKWKRLFDEVNADKHPLDTNKFSQAGVRVKFGSEQSYYHRKSILLDKLKKHRLYSEMAQDRLKQAEMKLDRNKETNKQVNEVIFNPMTHKNVLSNQKATESKDKTPDGVVMYQFPMGKLAIGLSAQGNDYIRGKWANKKNYWFHLDGDTSPHAIWKGSDDGRPSMDIVILVSSAILDHSSIDRDEINIIYTEVKNLKAVKGSAGKVIYKKEKHLRVWRDRQWRKNLLELQ